MFILHSKSGTRKELGFWVQPLFQSSKHLIQPMFLSTWLHTLGRDGLGFSVFCFRVCRLLRFMVFRVDLNSTVTPDLEVFSG